MRRLLASGLALALAVLAVTTFARTPAAQTAHRVLEACARKEQTIDARALPGVVDPGECPAGGGKSPTARSLASCPLPARRSTRKS